MNRISFKTLGDLQDGRCQLIANCIGRDCAHGRALDLDRLIARYGRDHSIINEITITSRLTCQSCGYAGGRLTIRSPGHA